MSRPSPLRRLLSYASAHPRTVRLASLYSILNKIMNIAPEILIGLAQTVQHELRIYAYAALWRVQTGAA